MSDSLLVTVDSVVSGVQSFLVTVDNVGSGVEVSAGDR